ncbi:hypothetical protein CEXT_337581 [Caerostris extrusa]|uniref:Uncharacterized protein n=1 Tax=Caerostris extrusa TaxID=172846 RepID=A0AAV4QL86_CAEEX|nr:hypothetical protein CEXT_337581 [Caerostris extrusa]
MTFSTPRAVNAVTSSPSSNTDHSSLDSCVHLPKNRTEKSVQYRQASQIAITVKLKSSKELPRPSSACLLPARTRKCMHVSFIKHQLTHTLLSFADPFTPPHPREGVRGNLSSFPSEKREFSFVIGLILFATELPGLWITGLGSEVACANPAGIRY